MATRTRFAASLVILAILHSPWLFPQEATAKNLTQDPAPEQTASGGNTRVSRTHCDVPSCVQKVLYFSNISQAVDMQDVVNAMRAIAEIQRVQQIIGAQIIIIEGTAEQVAMAEKLAAEIDKDKRRFGGLGYRIDVKIQESGGDKKPHSRLYSFVTDARQGTKASIGTPASAQVQNESASEPKHPSDSSNAPSIECRIVGENEHTLELSVEAEFAGEAAHEPGSGPGGLVRTRSHVTVQLDKPTVINRIDDSNGNSSFTIEVTATRIKER